MVLATGGIGRACEVTSNSWEYSGDGHALAYQAGAELIDMEFVQFHPTGMVWPPGVRGLLVTEAVRGEGGILRNRDGERFMWRYLPEERRHEYAETEEEASRWVEALSDGRQTDARRPPELSTRDNVARAIHTEVREGRGSPHGGVFLDISYLPAERCAASCRRCIDQFKELADVDITAGPMEVGPTCHYMMGGVRVDPETGASTRAGPVRGRRGGRRACTAPTGWAATRSRTCSCSASAPAPARPPSRAEARRQRRRDRQQLRRGRGASWLAPFDRAGRARTRTAARRAAGRDAVAGRHLPHRRPTWRRRSSSSADLRERWTKVRVVGPARLQPGLAPGVRPAEHADLSPRRSRAAPCCAPRAGAPTRGSTIPDLDPTWGKRNSTVRARRRGDAGHRPSRCPRCRTSCGS